jgi:hypothetical protein
VNILIHFANHTNTNYWGDHDSYEVSDGGVLKLDVIEDGKRVQRTYSPGAWLQVVNQEPSTPH